MRTLHTLQELSSVSRPLVLAAGTFDGVHTGHASVIDHARRAAEAMNGETWVLTFDPHPLKILHPASAPGLLTSTPHKVQLLAALSVDGCLVLPFTPELARVEPEDFINQLCHAAPSLKAIVIGANWTFGRKARGDVKLLKELAVTQGFDVHVASAATWKNEPVSSTRIRRAVSYGHFDEIEAMLGRPFSMLGTVVHGKKLGRELGFPTANLDPHNEVHPPAGIYAVRALIDGAVHPAAAYLGGRRTEHPSGVVEVFIMDFAGDLYGRDIEIVFVKKLRDDHAFPDHAALALQIGKDVEHARRVLCAP